MAIPAVADRLSRIDHPEADDPGVFTYSTNDGLATDFVVHVTAHPAGRINVTHMRAIDRRDPATSAIKHYLTADGLPGSEFKMAFRDRGAERCGFAPRSGSRASCPPMNHPSPSRRSRSETSHFRRSVFCVRARRARDVGAPFDTRSEQQCSYFKEVVNNMVRHSACTEAELESAPMNRH